MTLDRKIELDHPDANKLLQSFGLSTIANGFEKATVTDELNRPHTVHSDGLGRTIRSDALLSGATVTTGYQYDLLDRLTGLTDHAGNHWTYTYDFPRPPAHGGRSGPRQLVVCLRCRRPAHRPDRRQGPGHSPRL